MAFLILPGTMFSEMLLKITQTSANGSTMKIDSPSMHTKVQVGLIPAKTVVRIRNVTPQNSNGVKVSVIRIANVRSIPKAKIIHVPINVLDPAVGRTALANQNRRAPNLLTLVRRVASNHAIQVHLPLQAV